MTVQPITAGERDVEDGVVEPAAELVQRPRYASATSASTSASFSITGADRTNG